MNFKIKNVILPMAAIIAGLSSCYPVDDLTYEDLDIVGTLYDKAYYAGPLTSDVNKFQDFQTFKVVDTVMHIVGEGETDDIQRTYDAAILQQVRNNMLELGYTEEANPTLSDLVMTVSVMSAEVEVYYWYPYWGYYWGYGGYYPYSAGKTKSTSYYGYYYPWYGYGTTYTYTTGTLLIEMVDNSRVDSTNNAIPVIWAGFLNGLLGDTQSATKLRVSEGIDQCFNQSPYLFKEND